MNWLKFTPILLLAACNGSVTAEHIRMATTLCAPNGGVNTIYDAGETAIRGQYHWSMTTKCNNGTIITQDWDTQ